MLNLSSGSAIGIVSPSQEQNCWLMILLSLQIELLEKDNLTTILDYDEEYLY
jgi:hypothetical protein